jgi:hypothetical protein
MQPSAMAPRAKTAASLSFQPSSSVADNLACGNSTSENIYLMQELLASETKIIYNRIHFDPTCSQNLHGRRILPDVTNYLLKKVIYSTTIYSYHVLIDHISSNSSLVRNLVHVRE